MIINYLLNWPLQLSSKVNNLVSHTTHIVCVNIIPESLKLLFMSTTNYEKLVMAIFIFYKKTDGGKSQEEIFLKFFSSNCQS